MVENPKEQPYVASAGKVGGDMDRGGRDLGYDSADVEVHMRSGEVRSGDQVSGSEATDGFVTLRPCGPRI